MCTLWNRLVFSKVSMGNHEVSYFLVAASAAFFASAVGNVSHRSMGWDSTLFTSSLLLTHLGSHLLLLALHLSSGHRIALLLYRASPVSDSRSSNSSGSPPMRQREYTNLISQLLLISLTCLVTLISSCHLEWFWVSAILRCLCKVLLPAWLDGLRWMWGWLERK